MTRIQGVIYGLCGPEGIHMTGRKMTPATRAKMSVAQKARGKRSPETIERMRIAQQLRRSKEKAA